MKQILINSEELQTRVAVVEDGVLQDFFMERTNRDRLVGSIYKARIKNLEPSLQASFVDIGCGKNAFLHYWDMLPASQEMLEGNEDENGTNSASSNNIQLLPLTSEPPPRPKPQAQRQRSRPRTRSTANDKTSENPPADQSDPKPAPAPAPMPTQKKSSFLKRLAKFLPVFSKGDSLSSSSSSPSSPSAPSSPAIVEPPAAPVEKLPPRL